MCLQCKNICKIRELYCVYKLMPEFFFIINALLEKKRIIPAYGQASFAAGWRLDMGLSKADTDVDIEQELLNWGPHGAANGSA